MSLSIFRNPIIRSPLLSDQLDYLFNTLESKHHTSHALRMPIDIKENPDSFHIIADLPGLTKQDVKISIEEDKVLVIEAERKQENKVEGVNYYRVERSTGHTSRSFALPENVDPNKVTASFENGVLTVTVGKKTPDQIKEKVKTIEIN